MNYSIPCVNNFSCVSNSNNGFYIQNSVNRFTNYFYVPFYGFPGFQVLFKFEKVSFFRKKLFNFINCLLNVFKPGLNFFFHKYELWFARFHFLKTCF